jgi:hypothetical protein
MNATNNYLFTYLIPKVLYLFENQGVTTWRKKHCVEHKLCDIFEALRLLWV